MSAVDAADERYTIISADSHAGLPCEEYRPYLQARHLDAFDAFLAERHAQRDEQMKLNYDYITDWETTHEEGLRGAYDAEQREDHQRREHRRQIKSADRALQHIADAGI